MIVKFRTIKNNLYELDLSPTDTIQLVKQLLASKYGLDSSKMKLIHKAKILTDATTVESLRISESDFIVLHTVPQKKSVSTAPATANTSAAEKPIPSAQPLPGIARKLVNPDPPNFRESVKTLVEMGFNEGDCECALRSAVGNLERATEYLISGYIPDVPHLISVSDVPIQNQREITFSDEEDFEEYSDLGQYETDEEEDSFERLIQMRDEMIHDPEALRSFLNQMAEENPCMAGFIQDDPASFLTSIGFNPNDFDLSGVRRTTQYEEYMSHFTNEEQNDIHSLERLGYDTMLIIQVFEACNKDLEETRKCLLTMH